jgi:hypothetical protein
LSFGEFQRSIANSRAFEALISPINRPWLALT